MSTWISDSDVQRVNGTAGVRPVPVSVEARDVLRAASEISEWTDGKFDVTFGALSGPLEVRSRSGQRHSRHARCGSGFR